MHEDLAGKGKRLGVSAPSAAGVRIRARLAQDDRAPWQTTSPCGRFIVRLRRELGADRVLV